MNKADRMDARRLACVLSVIALAGASGCATITGSETQNLSLHAQDNAGAAVQGASCTLRNDKGTWTARPPGFAAVTRSAEDLIVNCEAADNPPGMVRAISRANSGMFGNIIFGGGVGALIDHSKGTAYDYPSMIRVVLGASLVIDRQNEPAEAVALPATAAAEPVRQASAPASASASKAAAPPAAGLPAPGAIYRYVWADRQYGRRQQEFRVRIAGVDGASIAESFSVDGGPPVAVQVQADMPFFLGRLLGEGRSLLEFAPYLQAPESGALALRADVAGYPDQGVTPWSIVVQPQGWESISVPAGNFRAQRVDVRGDRSFGGIAPSSMSIIPRRFEYSAWYAPEIGRYVKLRHRTWNISFSQIGDEQVELLEYSAK